MKKVFTIFAGILLTVTIFAQSPEKISYQAVIRNSNGVLVGNTAVGMQVTILKDSVNGAAVYVETHTPTTNINGLIGIEIGNGTHVSGSFSTIDWSDGLYFIKTETDPAGGTNYSIIGTSQFLSVPYALYAKTTGDTTMWKKNGIAIYNNTGNVGIGTSTPGAGFNTKFDVNGRISFRPNLNDTQKALIFDNMGTAHRLYTDALSGTASDLVLGTYPHGLTNQLYLKQSTGHVGIGNDAPSSKLHIKTAGQGNDSKTFGLRIENDDFGNTTTGIAFSVEGGSNDYAKAGIAFERTTTYARGKLHFLNSDAANTNDVLFTESAMTINYNRNIGIGTTNPSSKLTITNGDVYVTDINKGVILKSPDGNCWRMTVSNTGTPVFTSITCP